MDFGIASVGAITILCLLGAQGLKASKVNNKWIPVACGIAGAALGVVGLHARFSGNRRYYSGRSWCCVWFCRNWR